MGTLAETANVDYRFRLRTKENKHRFPFAGNKRKFAVSVFCLQQTNRSCRFPLVPFYIYIYIHIHVFKRKTKKKSPGDFP
jgi:hypothetical protein